MTTQQLRSASIQQPRLSDQASLTAQEQPVRHAWWSYLVTTVAEALYPNRTPVVTQKQDAQGTYWHLYDPNTGEKVVLRSQQAALSWLEKRYSSPFVRH
jgi:hypothetical protein